MTPTRKTKGVGLLGAMQTTVRLMEARDTVRNLYRDEYAAKIDPWRAMVREVAAEHKCSTLATPTIVSKKLHGYSMVMFLAAVVEEVEAGR